jgi:hypothetical protein
LLNGGRSALPSFAPRIRVEVYVPIRYEPAYQDTLSWLIREFTELRGGCTVIENTGGYYLSQASEIRDDRVSVVYCNFPMNWNKRAERNEVLQYGTGLQTFLLENLWEEAILIATYPVSHQHQ